MQLTPLKAVIIGAWILAMVALAVVLPVTSLSGWIAIVGLGVLPLILMLRAWNQPSKTMSEAINEARRK